jgi:pimeloyl-ACP methyl ester carboxylesterase
VTRGTVVLLHGLGRTARSMRSLAAHLEAAGFQTLVIDYPSRHHDVATLARFVAARLGGRCAEPLHFVTHSLGGIVLRALVHERRPQRLGRTVMLAPPNRGSELATRLRRLPGYRLATGPAGQQVGTEPESLPNSLPALDWEVGIVVGDRPGWARLLGRPRQRGDGVVAVDHAAVPGMRDLLVVPCGHTFIMNDRTVLEQTVHFLVHGRFAR